MITPISHPAHLPQFSKEVIKAIAELSQKAPTGPKAKQRFENSSQFRVSLFQDGEIWKVRVSPGFVRTNIADIMPTIGGNPLDASPAPSLTVTAGSVWVRLFEGAATVVHAVGEDAAEYYKLADIVTAGEGLAISKRYQEGGPIVQNGSLNGYNGNVRFHAIHNPVTGPQELVVLRLGFDGGRLTFVGMDDTNGATDLTSISQIDFHIVSTDTHPEE